MRIGLLLDDNRVIHASDLLLLSHRAVCLRLIFIVFEVLDMNWKRLEIIRKGL